MHAGGSWAGAGEGRLNESALAQARTLITEAVAACASYDRSDLIDRLHQTARRSADSTIRVLVVGEYKQGKSTLVNSLLNATICAVDEDIATAVPTIVRYAETTTVTLHRDSDDQDGQPAPPEQIPFDQLAAHVSEAGNPGNVRRLRAVTVGVPRQLLAGGLELVDTPGVGGLGSAHTAVTIGALPMADAVVFVSDASQEYSAPELEFLHRARNHCPTILGVVTKVDFYPEWRRIVELNQAHLNRAGIAIPLLPVSSTLRELAVKQESADLNTESGFPALVTWLRTLEQERGPVLVRSVVNDILSVSSQLRSPLDSAWRVLRDPKDAEALVAELELTRDRVEALRSRAARWQQTLYDGFADLGADIDYDLRARTRELLRVAEETIDASDPKKAWEEFEPWLTRRMAYDIAENYADLQRRAQELADRTSDHFQDAELDTGVHPVVHVPGMLDQVAVRADIKAGSSAVSLGFTGLRGAYMGVLMFTMLGRMVGLAATLANPLAAGATVLLGSKAVVEQRQRELQARRLQAKTAVRQYVDEVSFQVGKDSRDTLRRIQRELRDTFTTRAEELQRSNAEALSAAQNAVRSGETERSRKLKDVESRIDRIEALKSRAAALAPELTRVPSPP